MRAGDRRCWGQRSPASVPGVKEPCARAQIKSIVGSGHAVASRSQVLSFGRSALVTARIAVVVVVVATPPGIVRQLSWHPSSGAFPTPRSRSDGRRLCRGPLGIRGAPREVLVSPG
ncbi:unnamed protein product, partial [Prorocentrum cordatum]